MARKVTIVYHQDPECWWAESPDIERYKAAREKLEDLRHMIYAELPKFLGEELEIHEVLSSLELTA
jgi:hypothetical protein